MSALTEADYLRNVQLIMQDLVGYLELKHKTLKAVTKDCNHEQWQLRNMKTCEENISKIRQASILNSSCYFSRDPITQRIIIDEVAFLTNNNNIEYSIHANLEQLISLQERILQTCQSHRHPSLVHILSPNFEILISSCKMALRRATQDLYHFRQVLSTFNQH